MSKFKVREAKTVGGYDAFIFEIGDEWMFGKVYDDEWLMCKWRLDGRGSLPDRYFLLPNHEPLRAEFEEVVKCADLYDKDGNVFSRASVIVPNEFAGMRVKVTLESLE